MKFWHRQVHDRDEHAQRLVLEQDGLLRMSRTFAPPVWLRDLGRTAWLLVGVGALVVAITWLLALTSTIVDPVAAALIVATVAAPVVTALARHGVARGFGAAIVVLAFVALAVLMAVLVIGGITSQEDAIGNYSSRAADKAQGWLQDAGVDSGGAASANEDVKQDVPNVISTLIHGVISGIEALTSLAFFVSFAVFSLFFLLKDGPSLRKWVDRHLGVPVPVAQTITGDVIRATRRYFTGVSIVAAFNGIVVGLGALLLDVPLAGTIAVVTAVTAYIPFIGAFVSGAFAVIIALGAQGTTTALIMLVVVILANGGLQNIVQPIAFGATLDLNPLLVLVVTISAGCIFGGIGLVLAAPLTSAAIQISRDLAIARTAVAATPTPESVAVADG